MADVSKKLKSKYLISFIIVGIILYLSLPGCALPDMQRFSEDGEKATEAGSAIPSIPPAVQEILSSADQITLAWDAPPSVDTYRVYYRMHGTSTWTLIEEIVPIPSPEYIVYHKSVGPSGLDNGAYNFAVTAVSSGEESQVHSSLDQTAIPATGWYLVWDK